MKKLTWRVLLFGTKVQAGFAADYFSEEIRSSGCLAKGTPFPRFLDITGNEMSDL